MYPKGEKFAGKWRDRYRNGRDASSKLAREFDSICNEKGKTGGRRTKKEGAFIIHENLLGYTQGVTVSPSARSRDRDRDIRSPVNKVEHQARWAKRASARR